jgi:DNA-binding MarR family transcriptional regulator
VSLDEDAFLTRIGLVSRRLKSEAERRLMEHGVHAGQQFILGCLWEQDGLAPGEIAVRIGVEAPTVTRAVQRMTSTGLLRVDADATDGRRVRIWLTPRGEKLREAVPDVTRKLQADALSLLSAKEQVQLLDLLGRIDRALGGEEPAKAPARAKAT